MTDLDELFAKAADATRQAQEAARVGARALTNELYPPAVTLFVENGYGILTSPEDVAARFRKARAALDASLAAMEATTWPRSGPGGHYSQAAAASQARSARSA
jgi:hypothetical protein